MELLSKKSELKAWGFWCRKMCSCEWNVRSKILQISVFLSLLSVAKETKHFRGRKERDSKLLWTNSDEKYSKSVAENILIGIAAAPSKKTSNNINKKGISCQSTSIFIESCKKWTFLAIAVLLNTLDWWVPSRGWFHRQSNAPHTSLC